MLVRGLGEGVGAGAGRLARLPRTEQEVLFGRELVQPGAAADVVEHDVEDDLASIGVNQVSGGQRRKGRRGQTSIP